MHCTLVGPETLNKTRDDDAGVDKLLVKAVDGPGAPIRWNDVGVRAARVGQHVFPPVQRLMFVIYRPTNNLYCMTQLNYLGLVPLTFDNAVERDVHRQEPVLLE